MNKKFLFILGLLFCFTCLEVKSQEPTVEELTNTEGAVTLGVLAAVVGGIYYYATSAKYSFESDIEERFDSIAVTKEATQPMSRVKHRIENFKNYIEIGAGLTQGIVLHGPSQNDQELLARAIAGETSSSFLSIDGLSLLGFSWVRTNISCLLGDARKVVKKTDKPVIVYIKNCRELLNHPIFSKEFFQLMSSLSADDRVTVIIGVKKPSVLQKKDDMFQEQVFVGNPDFEARVKILQKLVANIKQNLSKADLKKVAKKSDGLNLKSLEELVNNAAIIAAQKDLNAVSRVEFFDALYEMRGGKKLEIDIMTEKERKITAYHEAGHALVMLMHPEMNLYPDKITICPEGNALGYVMSFEKEKASIFSKDYFLCRIMNILGGCAAEELVFDLVSTGPSSDLQKATEVVRDMICKYGMSDEFGKVYYGGKDFENSKEVNALIQKFLETAYNKAINLLKVNRDKLDLLANALLEEGTLYAEEVYELLQITPPAAASGEVGVQPA